MSDFDHLNAGEREVLLLLAAGHTVKSVAAAIGRSENAVNERLREARRKIGHASSRDLARAFAAQDNRDEFSGVEPPSVDADGAAAPSHRRRGIIMGAIVMSVLAASLFALLSTQPGQPSPAGHGRDDTMIGPLLSTEGSERLRALHEEAWAENRDARWADATEAQLRAKLGDTVRGDAMRIRCGASVCEVAGTLDPGGEQDAAVGALQAPWLNERVQALGLTVVEFGIMVPEGIRPRPVFATYLQRDR